MEGTVVEAYTYVPTSLKAFGISIAEDIDIIYFLTIFFILIFTRHIYPEIKAKVRANSKIITDIKPIH